MRATRKYLGNQRKINARSLQSSKPYYLNGTKKYIKPFDEKAELKKIEERVFMSLLRMNIFEIDMNKSVCGYPVDDKAIVHMCEILEEFKYRIDLKAFNVLFAYTSIRTEGKMPKLYMQKVAETWDQTGIRTFEDALKNTNIIENISLPIVKKMKEKYYKDKKL